MDEQARIATFLYYGYLPDFQPENVSHLLPEIDFENLVSSSKIDIEDDALLIEQGKHALKSGFSQLIDQNKDGRHIVPLSGGRDSRAILAVLLDFGLRDQITTVTYGIPGAWDFELGCSLARELDLDHVCIDLNQVGLSTEKLLETAASGSSWTFLIDAYYNSLVCKEFGQQSVYWSGLAANNIAGWYGINPDKSRGRVSWSQALNYFINYIDTMSVTSIQLFPDSYNPLSCLPISPIFDNSLIDYYTQLFLFIEEYNYLRKVLIFKDFNYLTPFCSPDWVHFMLPLPVIFRVNNHLYKKILYNAFPRIFSYPMTENRGGKITSSTIEDKIRHAFHRTRTTVAPGSPIWNSLGIHRVIKYIDYDEAIRSRGDFKTMVYENLQDLKARNIIYWLNLDSIWEDHQLKNANHGKALMLLTALEISLKTTS